MNKGEETEIRNKIKARFEIGRRGENAYWSDLLVRAC